jgi:plastocyanin domain-containing protein
MKATAVSIIVAGLIIAGAILLVSRSGQSSAVNQTNPNNVSIVDGKQIIEISARGGYQPRQSIAKAGLPTIIRVTTNNTFDCSSSVRIPSMNIFKLLPQNGTTDIDLGSQQVGTLLGSCGMGMYRFEVEFQS